MACTCVVASEIFAVREVSPPVGAPFAPPLAGAVAAARGVEVRLHVHTGVGNAFLCSEYERCLMRCWGNLRVGQPLQFLFTSIYLFSGILNVLEHRRTRGVRKHKTILDSKLFCKITSDKVRVRAYIEIKAIYSLSTLPEGPLCDTILRSTAPHTLSSCFRCYPRSWT